jgi:hypothetical protein
LYAPVVVEESINDLGHGGWGAFTKHMEGLLAFMEKVVWPMDPEADVAPQSLMPFFYKTDSGEEDMDVLKTLMVMLTIGLQGQAFHWKYKFDFDVVWSTHEKAYLVLLNSVRRMWNRGLSERKAFEESSAFEIGVSTSSSDASAAASEDRTSEDFTTPATE